MNAIDRFWDKIETEPMSGCWIWTGATNQSGYGRFWSGERIVQAHRFSYEFSNGEIPLGLIIDHKCRNTYCCNPDHLEPVTVKENNIRGLGPSMTKNRHSTVTHCPKGHEYTIENTLVYKNCRECKACKRERSREARRRAKGS